MLTLTKSTERTSNELNHRRKVTVPENLLKVHAFRGLEQSFELDNRR